MLSFSPLPKRVCILMCVQGGGRATVWLQGFCLIWIEWQPEIVYCVPTPAGTFVFLFCYLFEAFFLHYFCALSFGPIQPENRNDCPAEGRLIMFDLPCSTFFPKLLANNLSRFSYQLLARWCPSPYDPVVTKRRHSSPSRWSATVRQQFSSCHFLFAFASQTQ